MNKILKRLSTLCISFLLIISAITPAFAGTAIDEIDCQRRAKIYSNEYVVKPFGDYEQGFFTHNLMGSPKLLSMFYNKSRNIYMYCLEPGAPAHSGNTTATDELQNCEFWNNLSTIKQDKLKILLLYGFPNVNYPDLCDCDEYAATQALIWELMGKPNAINIHESDHARAAYDRLKAKLNNFDIKPSFSNATVKLKWNGSKYTGSLNDTNNILSEFPVLTANGVNISQSGNILNFSSSAPLKSTVQSTQVRKNTPPTDSTLYLFWATDQQTMISGTGRVDPPSYNLRFETDHGTMKIVKKSESGNVSGWEFKITGKGINKTVKTGKDGIIAVDLPVQEYTVEEINLPSYMKKPAPQKITVKYHQTASVSFENKYKEGKVQVIKVDKKTNKPIAASDAVFEAQTKTSGGKWQSLGNLKYNPSLKLYETGNIKITEHNGGTVRIYERKAPTGYVKNTVDFFDAKLTKDGEVLKITFTNNKNEGGLKIIKKSDSGNIKDIEFKITGNGVNKTVKTGTDGTITEKLSPGEYIVEELNVPWYFKVPAKQTVKIEYDKTAILNFNNKFKKINITVLKLDGETKKPIEATDAVFDVFEKISTTEKWNNIGIMTYKDGKYILNGISITNKNDGVIKVVEAKAPTGYIKSDKEYILDLKEKPFSDGQTFEIGKKDGSLTGIPNAPQKGKISLVKTDTETGKVIKDCVISLVAEADIVQNGEVKFKKGEKIAEKQTDTNGKVEFTDLYLGLYKAEESKAPAGYMNDSVPQIIELKYEGQEKDLVLGSGSFTDSPQKGKIRIIKTGEAFTSVSITETEDGQKIYKPVFSETPLKGAVYGIYAKEDIYLNGELKHEKDAEIARTTTDENGTAEQDNLYLGKMYIKEIKAPNGYILNPEPQELQLTYNGAVKEIVSDISFSNERQKFEISLLKEMEKDKKANLGDNGEILNVIFGLYAAEEFTAADGKTIPKDALIETGSPDKNGTLKFTADLPQGKVYVKELSTDKSYILNGETYDIELKYDGDAIKVIPVFANGKKPIFNKLKSGVLEITKKDISDGKLLPDTGFRIKDENGGVVSEGRTDKNGIAKFSLRYGKYTYQEFDAPKGYLIDEKEYSFEITEDGQIVKAEMKNKKIPEAPTPEIPKTGKLGKSAKAYIAVYSSVAVISAAAVIIFSVKKKNDE